MIRNACRGDGLKHEDSESPLHLSIVRGDSGMWGNIKLVYNYE